MRKFFFLITILCFTHLVAFSQSTFIPETNLGLKLGGTLSRVNFNPRINQGLHIGYTGGFVFKYIPQKSLGIQLELNYLQVGWNESLDSTNAYSRSLDYVQVPFMTHACIGQGNTRFLLNLGPYLSLLVRDKEKINLLAEEEERIYYRNKIENPIEFGLCLGIGFCISTPVGLFQVESRVHYSLTSIFQETEETPFLASQNQSVELTLSYLLDIKNRNKKH
jgi:hypothetical protein